MRKLTIFTIIVDLFILGCFIMFYGNRNFKNMIISTAMNTKTHQYIAYTFYDEKTVSDVILLNSYIPFEEDVNLDDIVIDTTPKDNYENEYDAAILTRDDNNQDYKYIKVKIGDYDGHLVAIYDPSKVRLITSKSFNTGYGAETVLNMCKRLGGIVCVNGGAFADPDGWGSDIPQGYLIKDGKIIWSDGEYKSNLIGFSNDNKLMLVNATGEEAIEMGMRDALEFGPFLMVNGKKIQYQENAGGFSRAARVAIAQRKDGVVLFLVSEGVHSNGPTLSEMADLLEKYGAYNAANLDGGTSSQLVIGNELINRPLNVYGQLVTGGRPVVSGFGVIK